MVSSVILLSTATALSLPYAYEFTSGALTGGFTADFDHEFGPFKSWNITAPTGFGTIVWDSTNPGQVVDPSNDISFFGIGSLGLITPDFPETENRLALAVIGASGIAGTYFFNASLLDPFLFVEGTGNWERGSAVPGPNTLCSFALGLLALIVVHWLSPIGCNSLFA
jgi:hypothetical protein